ncbi:hypothetical protein [Rhodoferax fermentans]|nr:hypothetical protein [Rhodoferax fermentans]
MANPDLTQASYTAKTILKCWEEEREQVFALTDAIFSAIKDREELHNTRILCHVIFDMLGDNKNLISFEQEIDKLLEVSHV